MSAVKIQKFRNQLFSNWTGWTGLLLSFVLLIGLKLQTIDCAPAQFDSSALLKFNLETLSNLNDDGIIIDSYGNPIESLKPKSSPNGKQYVNTDGLEFEIPSYASGITVIRRPANDLLPPFNDAISVAVLSDADSEQAESEQRALIEVKRAELIQLPPVPPPVDVHELAAASSSLWQRNNRNILVLELLPPYDYDDSSAYSSLSSSSSSSESASIQECGGKGLHRPLQGDGDGDDDEYNKRRINPNQHGNSYTSTTKPEATVTTTTTTTTTTSSTTTRPTTAATPTASSVAVDETTLANAHQFGTEESFTYSLSPDADSSPIIVDPTEDNYAISSDLVPPFSQEPAAAVATGTETTETIPDSKTSESLNEALEAATSTLPLDLEPPHMAPVNSQRISPDLEPPFELPETTVEARTNDEANVESELQSETLEPLTTTNESTTTALPVTLTADTETVETVEDASQRSSAVTLALDLAPPFLESATYPPPNLIKYDEAGNIEIARDLEPPPAPFDELQAIDLPAPEVEAAAAADDFTNAAQTETETVTETETKTETTPSTLLTTTAAAAAVVVMPLETETETARLERAHSQDTNPFLSVELQTGTTTTTTTTETAINAAFINTNILPANPFLPKIQYTSTPINTEQAPTLSNTAVTTINPITESVIAGFTTGLPNITQTLALINQLKNGNAVTQPQAQPSPLLLPPLPPLLLLKADSNEAAKDAVASWQGSAATTNQPDSFSIDLVAGNRELTPKNINEALSPSPSPSVVEHVPLSTAGTDSTTTRQANVGDVTAAPPKPKPKPTLVDNDGRYRGGFGGPPGLLRPPQPASASSGEQSIYVAGNKHDYSKNLNKANSNASDQSKYKGGFGAPAGVLTPNAAGLIPFQNTASSSSSSSSATATATAPTAAAPPPRKKINFGGPPGILVPYDNVKRT